jgi:hypothetical protein
MLAQWNTNEMARRLLTPSEKLAQIIEGNFVAVQNAGPKKDNAEIIIQHARL